MTPLGQLRFGRMPDQWGLGMVKNSGDGIDSDYQTTTDRIMFVTGIKSMDLYFGGAWDFISNGPSATPGSNSTNAYTIYGGQPYNTCNLCNVNEYVAFLAHRTNPELQRLKLTHGDLVVNGGLYTVYRSQNLDVAAGTTPETIDYSTAASLNNGLEPRQAWALIPDLWVQALWRKLRFEAEAVTIQGQLGYIPGLNSDVGNPVDDPPVRPRDADRVPRYRGQTRLAVRLRLGERRSLGLQLTAEQRKLHGRRSQSCSRLAARVPYGPISTFRFHPDYRVDLIFFRNILSRVEGAYYFRPSVDYDFLHPDGEKFGGGAAVIWSRASEFVQTPGHARDLGVELDLQLYYQSKDGSLNDDPNKLGGFYAALQYGVFFPLGGLDYLPGDNTTGFDASLSAAQIVRLFLGAVF